MKQKASGTEIILTVMTRKGIANSSHHHNKNCLLLFNLSSRSYLKFRNPTDEMAVMTRQVHITGYGCLETK